MALDTGERRFSALNIACPWRGPSILPPASMDAPTELALLGFCSEFAIVKAFSLTAISGAYNWTGNAADLVPTVNIGTASQWFSAMNPLIPWRGPSTFPTATGNSQRLSLLGLYSGLTYGFTYVLNAESGSFVWDGEPSFSDFEVGANAGTFDLTGNDATLIATRTAFLETGVFTMTGNDASLVKFTERTLVAASGVFTVAALDLPFERPRTMVLDSATFDMSFGETELIYTDASGVGHPSVSPSKAKGAGKARRKHANQLEVDGKIYTVRNEDEAIALLEKLKEEAKTKVQIAISRANVAEKRPPRKVLADARKTLQTPEITAGSGISDLAKSIHDEIEALYREALQTIEIAVLLRKQAEEEDETTILTML